MKKIKTVLIVDDSEIDHVTAKYAIEDYHADTHVITAYDGEEGLAIIRKGEHKIDVILLDINMPGMDGHEFLKEYSKESNQASVVVMLTSSDQEADKQKCAAYDFVKEYLCKPLESEDLKKIEAFLDD